MATAGNANPELVAGRTREGGMATLNETLLGHSIRVTGPLLSRHRGRRRWLPSGIRPAFSRTERARAAGEVQTNSAAAARACVKGLTLPPPLRCPLTTTFSELRLPSCVRKVPSAVVVGRSVTAP